jgi:hypothetical protein
MPFTTSSRRARIVRGWSWPFSYSGVLNEDRDEKNACNTPAEFDERGLAFGRHVVLLELSAGTHVFHHELSAASHAGLLELSAESRGIEVFLVRP